MTTPFDFPNLKNHWHYRQKGCRRRFGCAITAMIVFLLILCGLLALAIRTAQAAETIPLSVILIIDNSHSVFTETDPDGLRFTAARLFLTALGIHEDADRHQAGLIFFGSQAETAVSLHTLAPTATHQYDHFLTSLSSATAMGWTNPVAALSLAREQLVHSGDLGIANGRSAILLLTDGKPEWRDNPTASETEAYMADLLAEGEQLAQANITLFTILLRGSHPDNDDVLAPWLPIWQTISRNTPSGQLWQIEQPNLLPSLYHDLLTTLTQQQTAGAVVQTALAEESAQQFPFLVPDDLANMTLMIQKSNPQQQLLIRPEHGEPLTAVSPTIRHHSQTNGTEEFWQIELPTPGLWQIDVTGSGQITVWEDYELLPTVTATMIPTTIPVSPTALAPHLPPFTVAISPTMTTTPPMPTASATRVVVPSIHSTQTPAPQQAAAPTLPKPSRWLWLLLPFLVVVAAVYGWQRHQARPLAAVSGTLFILSGGDTSTERQQIELDTFKKPAVTIGQAPADIALIGATATLTIQLDTTLNEMPIMRVSGDDGIQLNGRFLTQPMSLHDNAHLLIPPNYTVRYENLRLRAIQRNWQINPKQ
ncbi:MAG: VWA domain-containing protein [Anaerolineales bacterium]|nr:VWA domain-containing protein [Anaerolineales bacterium]